MGLDALKIAIAECHKIFIDTMVFAYLLEDHELFGNISSVLLDEIERGIVNGITSTLTIAELLTAPAKRNAISDMRDYELYLTNFPHLEICPLDTKTARYAAMVRGETNLKMPDAIQIATAQSHGADAIVTNDQQWLKKVSQPQVLLLKDYLY